MILSVNTPLVSVLVTAYNRDKYIRENIESVLASFYTNFELIISDDASNDNTVKIAREYESKDTRVKVYVNEKNIGDYNNRNIAAGYATGKYIKYLDSDDIIFPWGLQVMVHCMEKYPSAALGLTANVYFDMKYPLLLSPAEAYKMYYFRNLVLGIGPTGTILRRELFEALNGFSGKQFVGDTELWLRIAQGNNTVWMPPGLFYWRKHEDQQIVLEQRDFEIEVKRYELHRYFLNSEDCPLAKEQSVAALRNLTSIKCRSILKTLLKGRIVKAYSRKNSLRLTWHDFFLAGLKNKTPR